MIDNDMENIYIVLTQSGTIISKILKFHTKDKYNHVSISLDEKLEEMYSFSRYYAYYPFWGGFIKESLNSGVLKRKVNADCQILRLTVTKQQYSYIKNKINNMLSSTKKYRYNMSGAILAGFGKKRAKRKYRYYCSEFVREVLVESGVITANENNEIMLPMQFSLIQGSELVYEGRLHEYCGTLSFA